MAGVLPDPPIKNRPISKAGVGRLNKLGEYPAHHLSGPLPRLKVRGPCRATRTCI